MVEITDVLKGSPADRKGIRKGDFLISVNGNKITDILDYRFYLCEKNLSVLLCREGKEFTVKIKKAEQSAACFFLIRQFFSSFISNSDAENSALPRLQP